MEDILQIIAIWALPVLFAITLHEASHGLVAKQLGDPTAKMLGRLTANPLKHVDPVGTVLVPIGLLLLTALTPAPPFVFGWAKPVPVNINNLGNPQRDMAIVAVAGPTANLLMAIFWALMIKLSILLQGGVDWVAIPLFYMGIAGVTINILLMVLNMLPLPPLDGGRVVAGFLPSRVAARYERLEPYGLVIILILLFTGILGAILFPVYGFFVDLLQTVFALPSWR
ncbi:MULTISPECIES: site-2 protease family protein [Ectothiorhodospira]|uniref:Zn-dependent protease (Includes SpoIVFB) n=1 Tax=Ectothiorhodospira marina TaxID=1396821 RepID=A0A1H7FZD9_9GAMM|nr:MULTISPECIES: site-2 protease family protein [Ectothiorhodospira]MCG5515525.1 site-2 protease family protein [Ectothiorhodospira sp. 9100]MCG5518684.1 site-2 protease family protein [Ectothiorhodospira sp. 9905]SEK31174.1 Zn-dependent protease (includes SpoIVFB) [Ectothiorhodospira marina]